MSHPRFSAFILMFFALVANSSATSLTDSDAAPWKQDFKFVEKMKIYDFPEQQISYAVKIPAGIKPESLTLLAVTDSDAHAIPFQLSDKKSEDGALHATLSFRTDLPQGATRWFRLVSGLHAGDAPATTISAPALQTTGSPAEAILGNSLLQIRVPSGHVDFPNGKPLSQVAAPDSRPWPARPSRNPGW